MRPRQYRSRRHYGRTDWRRFASVFLPSLLLALLLAALITTGVLPTLDGASWPTRP